MYIDPKSYFTKTPTRECGSNVGFPLGDSSPKSIRNVGLWWSPTAKKKKQKFTFLTPKRDGHVLSRQTENQKSGEEQLRLSSEILQ